MVTVTTNDFQGRWWLVHTKSRQEKTLAEDLGRMGITYFLPLARVKRRYCRQTTDVRIPFFPGYLFICGGEDERYATFRTHRVANVINVVDQPRLKADLAHIHRIVTNDSPVDVFPGIKVGRRCRVIRGCLKGLEGVVLRRCRLSSVYVAVDALGQSVELEIDPSLLEVIE